MFTKITEKLASVISVSFYRNNNSLRYREVIRNENQFNAWIKDCRDFFIMQLEDNQDLNKIRDILSIS